MGRGFEETIHNEDVEEQECVLGGLNIVAGIARLSQCWGGGGGGGVIHHVQ